MSRRPTTSPSLTLALLGLLAASTACDPAAEPAAEVYLLERACPGGVGPMELQLERHVTAIGPSANELIALGDGILVVESGANTLSRFDRRADAFHRGFIDVGTERNPYAAAADPGADEVWVANYASHTVTVARGTTGEVLEEIEHDDLRNPSAVVLTADYAYVANVAFLGPPERFGPGSVTVIHRASREVAATLDTEFRNPHFLALYEEAGASYLMVSSSGAFELGDEVRVVSEGGLELFDLGADPVSPPRQSYPLGQEAVQTVGAPGLPLWRPGDPRVFFASGNAPGLFVFDLDARAWLHDAADPFWLYDAAGRDATHSAALTAEGLLLLTAFNQDALYVLDTACMELMAPSIDLGEVANMLEGPKGIIVIDEEPAEAYFLYSIANALGRLRLLPVGDLP